MCEGGVGFEFVSLDFSIGIYIYIRLSPHSNHVAGIYCGLNVAISRLDRGYADSTQIVEVPDLKHASRQSSYK